MKILDSQNTRREILRKSASLLGVTLCPSALTAILAGCEKDTLKTSNTFEAFDISEEPPLSTIGGAVKRTFGTHNGGRPVIIIRTGENDFVTFTSVCTHSGYELDLPSQENESLYCPLHGSEFSASSGEVERGPASASLQTFNTIFVDGVLKILF